ncbi:hypothetical protein TSOC_014940, partial [Tetrabaena socialis]
TEYITTPASSSCCSVPTSPVSTSSTCATADWLSPSTPRCSTSQCSFGSFHSNDLYDSDGSEAGMEEEYELEQCRRSLEGGFMSPAVENGFKVFCSPVFEGTLADYQPSSKTYANALFDDDFAEEPEHNSSPYMQGGIRTVDSPVFEPLCAEC